MLLAGYQLCKVNYFASGQDHKMLLHYSTHECLISSQYFQPYSNLTVSHIPVNSEPQVGHCAHFVRVLWSHMSQHMSPLEKKQNSPVLRERYKSSCVFKAHNGRKSFIPIPLRLVLKKWQPAAFVDKSKTPGTTSENNLYSTQEALMKHIKNIGHPLDKTLITERLTEVLQIACGIRQPEGFADVITDHKDIIIDVLPEYTLITLILSNDFDFICSSGTLKIDNFVIFNS